MPPLISVDNLSITEAELLELVGYMLPRVTLFAVRSSACNEDSDSTSMAGYFYSAVGVCRGSLHTEFCNVVQSYRGAEGSVIVQEFIPSDRAGVIFTNRGDGCMVINAAPGLCKVVVEGKACDEYVVSPKRKLMKKTIAGEKECLLFSSNGLTPKTAYNTETLTPKELNMVCRMAQRVESFFGGPQDIEWCILGKKLFVLQSRPITRPLVEHREANLYDSANIAESYSGIVLPLTLSFASHIYKIVYQNLLIASGLSRAKVRKFPHIFNNMVASFYGRMYYNMNSWYLMMAFMPGYKRNKENLEEMITSNIREEMARGVGVSVWLAVGYPFILIYKLLVFKRTIRNFIASVKDRLEYHRSASLSEWELEQCRAEYRKLSEQLLERWHIPVENDFLVMTYLGILNKRLPEDTLKELIHFGNISSQQVDSLVKLSEAFLANDSLREAITIRDVNLFDAELNRTPDYKRMLDEYFETYGGRFANELKLESADISEDHSKLMAILQLYSQYESHGGSVREKSTLKPDRFTAWALKRFKKYAAQRETLRLLRSNCFGVVRQIFNRMGSILHGMDIVEEPNDIYYLELHEVLEADFGAQPDYWSRRVNQRKSEYNHFRTIQPRPWFILTPGQEAPIVNENGNMGAKIIQARPCTPGVLEGRAKVFREFYLPQTINFDILVARHTDPGWTPLIGLSKGLIIEHGGILSHAAIVSRELGIPTVIGAENATLIIRDGDRVGIDGRTGVVDIL